MTLTLKNGFERRSKLDVPLFPDICLFVLAPGLILLLLILLFGVLDRKYILPLLAGARHLEWLGPGSTSVHLQSSASSATRMPLPQTLGAFGLLSHRLALSPGCPGWDVIFCGAQGLSPRRRFRTGSPRPSPQRLARASWDLLGHAP